MALTIVLVVVVLVNFSYYLLFYRFSRDTPGVSMHSGQFPVSLIVCARNEAENLKRHIPVWLAQDYPDYELVLVNDHSSDDTLEVMEAFEQEDNRVVVVDVKRSETFWGSKKFALTLGIRRARHKRLLFTDADCRPTSSKWLAGMTAQLSSTIQLVLGYGGYKRERGLLNKLIRYETTLTAIQYFSYALAGIPYMGVGRNLAYTSNLFYQHSGFTAHMQLPSGDDDLFVNKAATADNTAICYDPDAFTRSIPKRSWREWLRQKKRHSSTAVHYRTIHKICLALYYLGNLAFWVLFLAGLMIDWKIFLLIGMLRIVVQYLLLHRGFKKLKESNLLPFLPVLELFLVLTQLAIFISPVKKVRWK